jgi:hypothetical protein
MKDEEAIDWREGFLQLPLDKENKFKEGSWEALGGENFLSCVFGKGKEWMCERRLSLLCVKKFYLPTYHYLHLTYMLSTYYCNLYIYITYLLT